MKDAPARITFRFDKTAAQSLLDDLAAITRTFALADMYGGRKTGHLYWRPGQGKPLRRVDRMRRKPKGGIYHRASAPGESPAVDTSKLVSNLRQTSGEMTASVGVRSQVKYAPYLEFGTSRMAARPFLYPAAQKAIQKAKLPKPPVSVKIMR